MGVATFRLPATATVEHQMGLWVRIKDVAWFPIAQGPCPESSKSFEFSCLSPQTNTWSASVRVVGPTGAPVADAVLRFALHPDSGPDPTLPELRTDAEGRACTTSLPRRGYALDVVAKGLAPVRILPRFRERDAPEEDVVVLPDSAVVALRSRVTSDASVYWRVEYRAANNWQTWHFAGKSAPEVTVPVGIVNVSLFSGRSMVGAADVHVSTETQEIVVDN